MWNTVLILSLVLHFAAGYWFIAGLTKEESEECSLVWDHSQLYD